MPVDDWSVILNQMYRITAGFFCAQGSVGPSLSVSLGVDSNLCLGNGHQVNAAVPQESNGPGNSKPEVPATFDIEAAWRHCHDTFREGT
jgi:hypothetical protein